MAEKKKRKTSEESKERRFVPDATHTSSGAAYVGMLGSLALGAGVYGQWIKDPPIAFAPAFVTAGAVALGFGLWLGSSSVFPIRIGDRGVAIEQGSEITRLYWCDISEIRVDQGNLMLVSKGVSFSLPLGAHPRAISYLLAEAQRRLPAIVKVDESVRGTLPTPSSSDGEEVAVTGDQVAGRRCAATQKILSFERDARLCPTCAQAYHKDNVPKTCVTCGVSLAGRTTLA